MRAGRWRSAATSAFSCAPATAFSSTQTPCTGSPGTAARTGRIINLVFHPLLLGGTEQSLVYRRYLLPLLADEGFAALPLSPAVPWAGRRPGAAAQRFRLLFPAGGGVSSVDAGRPAGVLAARRRKPARRAFAPGPRPAGQDRIKKVLAYIAGHYREKLEVSQLAAAANISQSECYRCFQRCLGVSPIRYLLQYRLQKAARLLRQTSLPVAAVCSEAGFSHPSYFAAQFQQLYGWAPRPRSAARSCKKRWTACTRLPGHFMRSLHKVFFLPPRLICTGPPKNGKLKSV